jgi:hypothetical protein
MASQIGHQRAKGDMRVAYLHRIVRAFLAVDSVRQILLGHTGPVSQFEPHVQILMSHVTRMKQGICDVPCKAPVSLICKFMRRAFLVFQMVPFRLAYSQFTVEISSAALHWVDYARRGPWTPDDWHATVLSCAVVYGLNSFVERALIKNPSMCQDTRRSPSVGTRTSLLAHALGYPIDMTLFALQKHPLQGQDQPVHARTWC